MPERPPSSIKPPGVVEPVESADPELEVLANIWLDESTAYVLGLKECKIVGKPYRTPDGRILIKVRYMTSTTGQHGGFEEIENPIALSSLRRNKK